MASATVIVLPVIALYRGAQRLLPSCDRRNVVELWRVRLEREQAEWCATRARERPEG